MVGVALLVLFVDGRPERTAPAGAPSRCPRRPSREAGRLLRVPGFARLIVVGSVLGLATLSDGFLYLALEKRVDFEPIGVPAAVRGHGARLHAARRARWAGSPTAWAAAGCSWAGTRCWPLLYGVILHARRWAGGPCRWRSLLLGVYYAATDGVLMALGSALSPPALRGTSLALLGTATSIARLLASVIFGALWMALGMEQAIVCFGARPGGGARGRRDGADHGGREAVAGA